MNNDLHTYYNALYNYIQQKIDGINSGILQLQNELDSESNKDADKQNLQLIYIIQGKLQAYFSIVKSMRYELDQIESTVTVNDKKIIKGK